MIDLFKKWYHYSPGQNNKLTLDSMRLSDMEYICIYRLLLQKAT